MKQDIKTIWKNLADKKHNSAVHHIQYCILRAMVAKGEDKIAIAKHLIHKAFSPVTSTTKLFNGRTPFDVLSPYNNFAGLRTAQSYLLGQPAEEILEHTEIADFNNIYNAIRPESLIRHYSYFFTRQDIFEEYQLVQTAHAALELGAKLTADQVKNLHFTCCGVADLGELEDVEQVLKSMKVPYVVFSEPDIGNQKTSIGVYPLAEHRRGLLRNYKLLRFQRDSLRDIVDSMCETQSPAIEEVTV